MEKPIYLKLDTQHGVLSIPFLGIRSVDEFTVRYENPKELITKLIKVLDLEIDLYDVEYVYLSYDKYNMGYDMKCLSVKYAKNNFNEDSLVNFFCEYLRKDTNRIWNNDIKYVKTIGMQNFINTGRIEDYEIRNSVLAYFNDSNGYRKKRDTYFKFFKELGIEINKIKIDKVHPDGVAREKDLSVYETSDDNYLNHIIGLYRRGIYEFDEVMEMVGEVDLSELSELLTNGGYGIVDGVSDTDSLVLNDIKNLERCTGMSVEKLKLEHTNFGRRKGFRR